MKKLWSDYSMKNFKKAFTLAELLLCVGIIGIVSAMGVVIAKHSTDKAYNLFYYSGYINLYYAIADAKAQNSEELSNRAIMENVANILSKGTESASLLNNINFLTAEGTPELNFITYKAINDKRVLQGYGGGRDTSSDQRLKNPDDFDYPSYVFDDGKDDPNLDTRPDSPTIPDNPSKPISKEPTKSSNPNPPGNSTNPVIDINNPDTWPGPDNPNSVDIETNNGITFYYPSGLSDGLNGINAGTEVTKAIPITMTVPQRKTRTNNGIGTVLLVYVNADDGYLIPVADNGTVNLQTRRDLLPAYLDNGKVGRNNVINRNNFDYQPIAYASYRDAFCTVRYALEHDKHDDPPSLGDLIVCGINPNIPPGEGVLKIANPRKAR